MILSKQNLRLVWVLAKTDFKLRYYGSVLGYFWSLIKPFVMFVVLYVVFSVLMRWEVDHYQFYLLLGLIVWNFFVEASNAGLHSLLSKAGIIKKIYFPRILVVIASTLSAFLTLLLNLLVFFGIYFFTGGEAHWTLVFLPIFLGVFYLLVLGVSLFLSVLQVRYRDVFQVWELLLQIGFFLSPIIYPMSIVPVDYQKYFYLNPMTGLVEYVRGIVIDGMVPPFDGVGYVAVSVVIVTLMGYAVFKSQVSSVAEKI